MKKNDAYDKRTFHTTLLAFLAIMAAQKYTNGAAFAARAGTLDEVRALDFAGIGRIGVTSGASTPEEFLDRVVSLIGY